MILGDQSHVLVAGGEKNPTVQVVFVDDVNERGERVHMLGARPNEATLDVTGEFRNWMIADNPYRDAAASQTTRQADADLSSADNQRSRYVSGGVGSVCASAHEAHWQPRANREITDIC